jgi:hypothetical protein
MSPVQKLALRITLILMGVALAVSNSDFLFIGGWMVGIASGMSLESLFNSKEDEKSG